MAQPESPAPAGSAIEIRRRTDNPARDLREDRKRVPALLDAIGLKVQGLPPEDRVLLGRRRLLLHRLARSVRLSR